MDNQHKKIKGYRGLSQEEVDLMNRIKEHGEKTKALIQEVDTLRKVVPSEEEGSLTNEQLSESHRCLELAKTKLQTGQMWFVRAVALPDTF